MPRLTRSSLEGLAVDVVTEDTVEAMVVKEVDMAEVMEVTVMEDKNVTLTIEDRFQKSKISAYKTVTSE